MSNLNSISIICTWIPHFLPNGPKQLGKWLVIAHRIKQTMIFYIMNENDKAIARSTVTPIDKTGYDTEILHKGENHLKAQ